MKLVNTTSGAVLAETVELANTFLTRAKGLLFRRGIARTHALVLYQTYSIHMFMMAFTIDVIFLDKERRVTALFPRRRPFSLPVGDWSSSFAVEVADGRIAESGVQVGDALSWD